MSPPAFIASAAIIAVLALAHSLLGERFILKRLRDLPPLFGDDSFTRSTLRFAWHALSFAWWALAALLIFTPPQAQALVGWTVLITLVMTSLITIAWTRGRHLSWVVEWIVIALLWSAL